MYSIQLQKEKKSTYCEYCTILKQELVLLILSLWWLLYFVGAQNFPGKKESDSCKYCPEKKPKNTTL